MRRVVMLVVLVLVSACGLRAYAATTFMESGSDATQGLEFWTSIVGTVVSDATAHTGPRAIKLTNDASGNIASVTKVGVLADAGRRIDFYINVGSLPTNSLDSSGGHTIFGLPAHPHGVAIKSSGLLTVRTNLANKSGSHAVTAGAWTRITVSYVITSTTNYTIKVWVNGVLDITCTNADFSLTSTVITDMSLGYQSSDAGVANAVMRIDNIYVDDSTAITDPGDVRVTAKLPAALNTNNFDTQIGSSTNRYDAVAERPLSEAKGWQHAGITDVQENYGLQTASQGDVDLTGATLVARTAWVWAKRGSPATVLKNSVTNTGKASGTTLTLGAVSTAVGDVVVVMFGDLVAGSAPTIADNLANSWTQFTGSPKTNGVRSTAWFATVASGKSGSMTVTVTFGSSSAARAGVLGILDAGIVGLKDKDIAYANDATSPYDCPTSGTLAQANEVVLGFVFTNGPTSLAATSPDLLVGTAETSGGSPTSNVAVGMTYRSVNATTAVAPQMTGTSRTGVVGTASFKLSADPVALGDPKIMDNGSETSIALTTTSALYTTLTDSASYPSNAAGIGMRSSVATSDTFFYEGGTLIAYIPAAGGAAATPYRSLMGVGQ